jgi:hypothetical protein
MQINAPEKIVNGQQLGWKQDRLLLSACSLKPQAKSSLFIASTTRDLITPGFELTT